MVVNGELLIAMLLSETAFVLAVTLTSDLFDLKM